jgi:FemAB-related protein (PEP-CTERM system-associated)
MISLASAIDVHVWGPGDFAARLDAWECALGANTAGSLSTHPRWLRVLCNGLRHEPYCLEAVTDGQITGVLPLAFVRSRLFGRFLVSLPYLNSGGVQARDETVARALVDRTVELADSLDVKHLELRHEAELVHPALTQKLTSKVHMRLALPASEDELWGRYKSKLRSQIRSGMKHDFQVEWGERELADDFYEVFSRNMRDLGTPVFSRRLFESILEQFPGRAELCVVRARQRPIAAALLAHGEGVTEVPSASCLQEFRSTNVNMLMYWRLLCRAIERGQHTFDFGRSSIDSNTYRFKEQWGAVPHPAVWQYYVRRGNVGDLRIESGKYDLMIRAWRRLPLAVTRWAGPVIVRGIP